jgi:hypothetical protein
MGRILALVLLCPLSGVPRGDGFLEGSPKTAESIKAIAKAVAGRAGLGRVQSAHFDRSDREIFVIWYCPFSGRAACYVHGYYKDADGKTWKRFVNELIDDTHDLAVSLPYRQNTLVISDVNDKEIRKYDVSKFLRRRPKE